MYNWDIKKRNDEKCRGKSDKMELMNRIGFK